MKKIISAFIAMTSLAFAQVADVSVSANDLTPEILSYLSLEISAYNPGSVTRRVRINFELPGVSSAMYKVDNISQENEPDFYKCRVDYNAVDSLIYNFKKNDKGNYVLDAQFSLKPQDDKKVCFPILRPNLENFKVLNEPINQRLTWKIDQPGSPLDNPIIYNYIPKPRYSYNKNDDNIKGGLQYNTLITANVMNGGNSRSSWDVVSLDFIEAKVLIDLGVKSYGMYKDTRMLISSVGPLVDHYRWRESTFDGHMHNDVEQRHIFMGRCWAITAFNIYSHFYGNRNTVPDALTQDEIVFLGKKESRDISDMYKAQVKVFCPNDSEGGSSVNSINGAMPGANARSIVVEKKRDFNGEFIYNFLKTGKPLPFDIPATSTNLGAGHAMILDALAITTDGKNDTLVHIINIDNFGNERYIYLNLLRKHVSSYVLYDVPTERKTTDLLYPVDLDYDHDGILDFDEKYRFMTDPDRPDTDGDGIGDLQEVYSYISRLDVTPIYNKESDIFVKFTSATSLFNIENEANFPQLNPDTDGDGKSDSEEDLNKNGIYEPELGETDPFGKDTVQAEEIPSEIILYAHESLSMGDSVYCVNSMNTTGTLPNENNTPLLCNVVSEGSSTTIPAIDIGSDVRIRRAYTKGSALIRNGSRVFILYSYNKDAVIDDQTISKNMYTVHRTGAWDLPPVTVLSKIKFEGDSVVVRKGETLTIKDGDRYASVEVKEGGKIVFSKGEMYIGSVSLAYNSIYDIQNNGYATILHTNGPVIWHANNNVKSGNQVGLVSTSFKLYQHSDAVTSIDTRWMGTIIAPYSKLMLGQTDKGDIIQGQFRAWEINVRHNTGLYRVGFNPENKLVVADTTIVTDTAVVTDTIFVTDVSAKDSTDAIDNKNFADFAPKIVSMNRNELYVITSSVKPYQVVIAKADGSLAYTHFAKNSLLGINTISLKKAKFTNGNYFVIVKQNGRTSSKLLAIE